MHSQIKNYLSLGAAYLAGYAVNASIYYTDFDPDIWWQWDNNNFDFFVDVDHDGLNDYRFKTYVSSTEYYSCSGFAGVFFMEPLRENQIANALLPVSTPSEIWCPCVNWPEAVYNLSMGVDPYFLGDMISSGLHWGQSSLLFAKNDCGSPFIDFGLLTPTDEQSYYIPIKLKDHGDHYGWIRLNHKASIAEKKIFDMAYETIENKEIIAGARFDAIENEYGTNIVFSFTEGGVLIHSLNLKQPATYTLTDISGKIIQSGKILNSEIFISNKIISKGVYLITVNAGEGKWVKKFVNAGG